jgi:polyisoprenyl-teichoic acid--peptidoglycan teichoic acid transferase
MQRRTLSILISLAVLSACTAEVVQTTTTSSTTTTTEATTTTTQPTTTTTVPFVVEGAGAELTALVDAFYAYVTAESDAPPIMPAELLASIAPTPGEAPETASATGAVFKGQGVAVVEASNDLILAVDDGSGWRIIGGEWPDFGVAPFYGVGPRMIAVVGSDARTGEQADETRADSIHFVTLDGTGAGAVVGLPRDSYVPVPGHGTTKITGSLALGGPALMLETFRNLTGLPLEGYVLTGFNGFKSLIDILGGVEVEVPFPINDSAAKASLAAGLQVLNGLDALAFARARKTVPGGDFGRSQHQGDILVAAAQMVRGLGPSAVPDLLQTAEPYFHTDLSPEQLLTFSVMAIKANLEEMPNFVVAGSPGWAGSASVVYLADSAYATFADLQDGRIGSE